MAFKSTSSAYRWTYASDETLSLWRITSDQYKQMSQIEAVQRAAEQGGTVLKTAAQDLIYGTPSLNGTSGEDFSPVAERFDVWSDSDNVYFGVPEGDPAIDQAWAMDEVMPVIDIVTTTDGAAAVESFERALQEKAF